MLTRLKMHFKAVRKHEIEKSLKQILEDIDTAAENGELSIQYYKLSSNAIKELNLSEMRILKMKLRLKGFKARYRYGIFDTVFLVIEW